MQTPLGPTQTISKINRHTEINDAGLGPFYRATSYLRLLALSINLQPEYQLSSTRFGLFQKFGKT